jgi:hypothetical protein
MQYKTTKSIEISQQGFVISLFHRAFQFTMCNGLVWRGMSTAVDIPLHTRQHIKQMNVCCRITKFTIHEDSNFNYLILTGIK